MPVPTVASQSKKKICGIMFCMCRVVLFTALYAFLSLWVGLFEIQTNQTTQVSTQSTIKYELKLSKQAKDRK